MLVLFFSFIGSLTGALIGTYLGVKLFHVKQYVPYGEMTVKEIPKQQSKTGYVLNDWERRESKDG